MSDRRYFEWWCPNCNTLLRLETSESSDDAARNVDCCGCYTDFACPMCETQMWSADEALARETWKEKEPELRTTGWETFQKWLAKRKESP